jgi:hypothetical protein
MSAHCVGLSTVTSFIPAPRMPSTPFWSASRPPGPLASLARLVDVAAPGLAGTVVPVAPPATAEAGTTVVMGMKITPPAESPVRLSTVTPAAAPVASVCTSSSVGVGSVRAT